MKKIFAYILLLLLGKGLMAQDNVSVRLLNLPSNVKAGDRFTIIAEITSPTPMSQQVWVSVKIPQSWQIIAKKVPNRLLGLVAARFSYTVNIGKYATAGEQEVGVMIFKKGLENSVQYFKTNVEAIHNISITAINPPSFIKEGETLRTQFLIQNLGNINQRFRLETTYGYVDTPQSVVSLLPNSLLKMTVVQSIPRTDGNSWIAIADLKLIPVDSTSKSIQQVVSVPVFSTKTKSQDPYFRYPIEIGVWYNKVRSQNINIQGLQFDIKGKGFIDKNKKHYLDVILHGPNQDDIPIMGSFNQYSVRYIYDSVSTIQLGDFNVSFSRLIEMNRFGRGVEFEQKNKKTSYYVIYLKPRFIKTINNIVGAKYSIYSINKNIFSVNYLSKEVVYNRKIFWANHIGVNHLFKSKKIESENEVAINSANGTFDFGVYSNTSLLLNKLRINSSLLYAGKNYFGFFNNGWQVNSSIFYDVSPKITFGIVNIYNRINPSFDLLVINTSPYLRMISGQVFYNINKKNRIQLELSARYNEDRQVNKQFHYTEDYIRGMYSYRNDLFNTWTSVETGYSHNFIANPDKSGRRNYYRFVTQNEYSIAPNFTLGANAEYLNSSKFSVDNLAKTYFYYGGLLRYRYKRKFDVNVNYRNSYAPDELITRRDFFNLQANLELGNHKLTAMGTQAYIPGYSEQNNFILSLQYRYLFNVAVAKVKSLGSIKGQITGSNVKKEGVLVQIGSQKYLTDTDGKFVINNLKPDRYAVNLFRSSMTMNDIPAHQGTLEVEVKADSTHTLEIPFIKAGMIAGKVNYEKGNNPGLAGDKIEKPTVLVKLFNGEDSHLTLANENGEFTFKEIKPGDWKLQATLMMGEGKFSISQPQRDVTVVAEQAKEVTFVVRPVSRTIRFIDRSIQTGSK